MTDAGLEADKAKTSTFLAPVIAAYLQLLAEHLPRTKSSPTLEVLGPKGRERGANRCEPLLAVAPVLTAPEDS